jgi:hypothetical protein
MDDTARISVSVAVPPHVAFEIFTHVGGRLFESIGGDAGPLFEVGRVRTWDPANQLTFRAVPWP